jgi:hypothetical protein
VACQCDGEIGTVIMGGGLLEVQQYGIRYLTNGLVEQEWFANVLDFGNGTF